jgi:hypothetical protein
MSNKDPRGYQEIEFETGKHRLLFTRWDLVEIEEQTGKKIPQLFGENIDEHLGFKEMLTCIAIGLKHEDEEITPQRVAKLMKDGQYAYYLSVVTKAITPRLMKPKPDDKAKANGKDETPAPLAEMSSTAATSS